jgi:hypothetical protein
MSTLKPCRFEVQPGEPLRLVVTTADGKRYATAVRLTIADVIETGRTPDGALPNLQLGYQVLHGPLEPLDETTQEAPGSETAKTLN